MDLLKLLKEVQEFDLPYIFDVREQMGFDTHKKYMIELINKYIEEGKNVNIS